MYRAAKQWRWVSIPPRSNFLGWGNQSGGKIDGEKDIAGETGERRKGAWNLKNERKRERERERDFPQNSNIFWDIFGLSIGPRTMRPLQPHGDEENPTAISCTSVGMSNDNVRCKAYMLRLSCPQLFQPSDATFWVHTLHKVTKASR